MNGLQPNDILILALVSAVSVLIIYLRIRSRRRIRAAGQSCTGCSGCNGCSRYCGAKDQRSSQGKE